MNTTVLEAPDDSSESNVQVTGNEEVESTETQKVEETSTADTQETQKEAEEATIEVDGEKIPLSQLKKWKEDYTNDSKWKANNQRDSETIKRDRERISVEANEIAQLRLLKPYLEQRPEILQQLFAPKPTRDYDAELRDLYSKQPDQTMNPQEYVNWQYQKDLLLRDSITQKSSEESRRTAELRFAQQHNLDVEQYGQDTYLSKGKVSQGEFASMTQWILENVNPKGGKYDKAAYDVAYKTLFEDKWLQEKEISAAKKAVSSLSKTTTDGANGGIRKTKQEVSPQEESDEEFIRVVREKRKGKWLTLPK